MFPADPGTPGAGQHGTSGTVRVRRGAQRSRPRRPAGAAQPSADAAAGSAVVSLPKGGGPSGISGEVHGQPGDRHRDPGHPGGDSPGGPVRPFAQLTYDSGAATVRSARLEARPPGGHPKDDKGCHGTWTTRIRTPSS